MMSSLIEIGENAKKASIAINSVKEEKINFALKICADSLIKNKEYIINENKKDIINATKNGKSQSFIDRLTVNDKVLMSMSEGLYQVATLKSPVGKSVYKYKNKTDKIKVEKKLVPFGVIGIIFESRPNVTADAFALCFKTKNAVILRGGSDAINSNLAICKAIKEGLSVCGIDENVISVLEDTSRETAVEFMKLDKYIDLLIPRGSASLINTALNNATVPIIQTGTGNCHVYVDKYADIDMAVKVTFNAKTNRYSTCNTCEALVVDKSVAKEFLPKIALAFKDKKVEMRCDEESYEILSGYEYLAKATKDDFYTEYNDAIISVKITSSLEESIEFINEHSTHHSESIITNDICRAEKFKEEIDSACVYHNASTRFSDGFVFGLGAEIGISTQKLHARGPMGLEALVTTKFFVEGKGSVRR